MDHAIVESPQEILSGSWGKYFSLAHERGFPAFLEPVELSNPLNSGPYVASMSMINTHFAHGRRSDLFNALLLLLGQLDVCGLQPVMLMLGGSFIRRDLDPKDLDCVVFYRRSISCVASEDAQWPEAAPGLDVRLVPIDVATVTVAKCIAYFSILYSQNRGGIGESRGCILVDLDCDQ